MNILGSVQFENQQHLWQYVD